jgi:hypothetical protein
VDYESVRRTPRYSPAIHIEMIDTQSEIEIRARTTMLSMFGCGADAAKLFPKGTTVKIKLSRDGEEVRAFARVIYSRSDLGMGVAFTNVEPEDERILECWIAEFQGIPIREPSIDT